jgi:hypothetical protein
MDRLLIPLAKILFAQKYHADSKEWVDKEWLEISDSERWLLTKRAETLLPFLDEAISLISEEYMKRIQVLEASLADCKNQVEQVKLEERKRIRKELNKFNERGYEDGGGAKLDKAIFMKSRDWQKVFNPEYENQSVPSKYGIK